MPLALDVTATFEIVLESDAGKSPETRPVFVCRYLSGRELRQVAEALDSLDAAASGAEAIDKVFEQLERFVTGWENMIGRDGAEIPCEPGRLADLLTIGEAQELAAKAMASGPQAADLKKSASQSPSEPDCSAMDAEDPAPGPEDA